MNNNLYFERVAYLGVHQHPITQARPCRPLGPVVKSWGST